ncbi:MAG: LmbE family N-acetylglucosaminyl deacetylase, partial [Marivirga sp.]
FRSILSLFICSFLSVGAFAQYEQSFSSSDILHGMQKLQKTARVLYIAAHPDDENTRFISYLVNDRKFETAYLALTRGDGGQNVIGSELRESLGLIRTQELLAARRTDGGHQFFTRANDFGYSKNPSETFNIWDREAVLSDVVWVIRKFQPDIIVTRFNETPGVTHGHHTASAILAHEAFKAAGDKNRFRDQLEFVAPWETKKLYWNTSSWFYGGDEGFDEANFIKVDVGGYDPVLGESYTEIAAISRSNHKSQAFGSSGTRGSQIELFEQWEGEKSKDDLFDGIATGWSDSENGEELTKLIATLIENYRPSAPETSIPSLLELHKKVNQLRTSANKLTKVDLIEKLILKASGFYHLLSTSNYYGSAGDSLNLALEIVNRSSYPISIESVQGSGFKLEEGPSIAIGYNQSYTADYAVKIEANAESSTPYWLKETASLGMYTVNDQLLIGDPENKPSLYVTVELKIDDVTFSLMSPVVFKETDRIKGEVIEPFYITPPLTIHFSEEVLIFTKPYQTKTLSVQLKALKNNLTGILELKLPEGWTLEDAKPYEYENLTRNETVSFDIKIRSGNDFGDFELGAEAILADNSVVTKEVSEIIYEHIPNQVIISDASSKLIFSDIKISERLIGYIPGAGDKIPEALVAMGYEVEEIDLANNSVKDLARYQTIVAGIRAYNTNEVLQNQYEKLFAYMDAGGTYIVQYNTTYSLPNKEFFPYKLNLSRDRITDENAEFKLLYPDSPIMNYPNKLSSNDFTQWVQERGLYFPNNWGEEYQPLLEGHDGGENAKKGALLVANYGKGKFVYTGISFFRELPAGVPGAYRLFSNIVSY